jgi:hypothetical protein
VVNEQVLWTLAAAGSAGAVFIAAFIANFTYAPVVIDREQRQQVAELHPPAGVILSEELSGAWVHLGVRNTGDTDVFIASVVDNVGAAADGMTVPWSMKWRQGAEEQRVTKGEKRLLEVGEADHGFAYPRDKNKLNYISYYYWLVSSSARFRSGGVIAAGLATGSGTEMIEPVDEKELSSPLSFLVEVRGVNLGSATCKWLNLGFKPDGTPKAQLTDEPLASPSPTEDQQSTPDTEENHPR